MEVPQSLNLIKSVSAIQKFKVCQPSKVVTGTRKCALAWEERFQYQGLGGEEVNPDYIFLSKYNLKMRKDLKTMTSLILQHTVLSNSHLTPELTLRLITPECPLWRARGEESPLVDPFWAFYWPGGQATARYILDNENIVKNRQVIDIGCGCGAGSIAAAKMKAKRVLANDIDPYAVLATKMNSDLNHVCFETSSENFIGKKLEDFDTVLIGDMFYDEEFAKFLFEWLRGLTSEGKMVLIGDPGRHGLTDKRRKYITQLAKYKLPEDSCMENNGFTETTLWKLNTD